MIFWKIEKSLSIKNESGFSIELSASNQLIEVK